MEEMPQMKICRRCGEEKSVQEFGILRSAKDGRNPVCAECKRIRERASRAKKAGKTKGLRGRPKLDKPEASELPKEKISVQYEEPAEVQLIRAFKKTTIKSFIKDDLVPLLEKIAEEKFQ